MFGDNLKKIKMFGGLLDVVNGKKSLTATIITITALAWGLMSPTTAPTADQLETVVDAGKLIIQDGKEVVEVAQQKVLPDLVALISAIAGLFAGLHAQKKILTLLKIVGTLSGRYVDLHDLKDPEGFLTNLGVLSDGSKGEAKVG